MNFVHQLLKIKNFIDKYKALVLKIMNLEDWFCKQELNGGQQISGICKFRTNTYPVDYLNK